MQSLTPVSTLDDVSNVSYQSLNYLLLAAPALHVLRELVQILKATHL